MTAGRRRRGRKATRRGRKGAKKGGAMYGFGGALDGTTAGAQWVGVRNTNFVDSATGGEIPNFEPKIGGRRRKGSKKTRKGRRKMRGGASQISMGGTYATFEGRGVGGMADYAQGVKGGNPY